VFSKDPRPEAVALGRPTEGAFNVRSPPLGAVVRTQASVQDFPAVLRYDQHVVLALPPHMGLVLPFVHKLLLPAPRVFSDEGAYAIFSKECTPDRSKLFGSHGQRPWV
jgi:hypothetical protein